MDLPPDEMKKALEARDILFLLGPEEIEGLISERIEKLGGLLNEKYVHVDATARDLKAHLALRMVAAADESGNVETWFLNNECAALRNKLAEMRDRDADLFVEMLGKLLFSNKVRYLKDYTFEACVVRGVMTEQQLRRDTGLDPSSVQHVAVEWKSVPDAVRSGACAALHKGVAIIDLRDNALVSQAIKNYELLLRRKIYALAERMTVEGVNEYAPLVVIVTNSIRAKSTTFVGIDNLEDELVYFPPCIVSLDQKIGAGFEVEHLEYLQLGFFLREAGMSFNDYQRYWYLRHPANRSKSWEEYSTSHWGGYQLKHHFGEIGSGKKYAAYSCRKAQNEAYCPFKDLEADALEEFLGTYLQHLYVGAEERKKLDDGLRKIGHLAGRTKRHYGAACGTEFNLRFKTNKRLWINHPIYSYYEQAKRIAREESRGSLAEAGAEEGDKVPTG